MTPQQLIQEFEQIIQQTVKQAKPFGIAVTTVAGEIGQRIFEDGGAADNTQIGQYSTKPARYSKPGSRVSKFYEGGYKEFKADIGRENSFVNLKLSRNLQIDFNNGLRKITPLKYQVAVSQKVNAEIITKMEDKYGKPIFAISNQEEQRIMDLIIANTDI